MPETLEFSSSLYCQSAIEETAEAYASLLDCQIHVTTSGIQVLLEPKVEGMDDLMDHFANHALHLSIVQSRGSES